MKFQIKSIDNDLVLVNVLDGTKVLFTKEFKTSLDLDLNRIKRLVRDELEKLEKEKKKEDEFQAHVEFLRKELNKKIEIN